MDGLQDLSLQCDETLCAVLVDQFHQRLSVGLDDDIVCVDKVVGQSLCQRFSQRSFSGSRHSDQCDIVHLFGAPFLVLVVPGIFEKSRF